MPKSAKVGPAGIFQRSQPPRGWLFLRAHVLRWCGRGCLLRSLVDFVLSSRGLQIFAGGVLDFVQSLDVINAGRELFKQFAGVDMFIDMEDRNF